MIACGWLIKGINEKLPDSRVMIYDSVSFNDNVTFPALTIIPEVFHLKKTFFEINSISLSMRNGFTLLPSTIDQICSFVIRNKFCSVINLINFQTDKCGYLIAKYARKTSVAAWFEEQFSLWNNEIKLNFSEIRTVFGMGYSLNLIKAEKLFNSNEIDNELLYKSNIRPKHPVKNTSRLIKNFYPITTKAGDRPKLKIKFSQQDFNSSNFERCNFPKVLVHHPTLSPTFIDRDEFIDINFGETMNIELNVVIIRTDKNLKKLKSVERGCYFDNEFQLKFFKTYTQKNCEIECFTNITIKECGCVSHLMPYNAIKNIIICQNEYQTFYESCLYQTTSKLLISIHFSTEQNCSCLPLCNSVSYYAKYNSLKNENKEASIKMILNIDNIVAYRRYQQFSFHDIISYVGGLLGLFVGVSVLSIVEIFYFIISKSFVRICSSLRAQ
ncbi:hypothetical protein PVAND_011259 [Polypedilum vanderplanki]|nr:hypothetical protein PVAND_011259 [Polypedilum vanderplanki]